MDIYPKNKIPISEVKKFIIIFYFVGIVGFLVPFTKLFFITITPFALMMSIYLLLVYHRTYKTKTVIAFVLVYLLGFFIEVFGVKTGLFFGYYNYGDALGIKIFDTPLLIGLNWLFLTYTSLAITRSIKVSEGLIIFFAPVLMLIYDVLIEQLAPKMDMWSWQNSFIPLKNYFAWYILGVCFVLIFKLFKIETKNPLATILFICQFMFFIFLLFFLK